MEIQNRLELDVAQQAATRPKATDQLSYFVRANDDDEVIKSQEFADCSDCFGHYNHLGDFVHPHISRFEWSINTDVASRHGQYLARIEERRAKLAEPLNAMAKEEAERFVLAKALIERPDLAPGLGTNEGLIPFPQDIKSSDYVSVSDLKPTNWFEGLDAFRGAIPRTFTPQVVPQKSGNQPITHALKRRDEISIPKAHSIAGYLRRKMLKANKQRPKKQVMPDTNVKAEIKGGAREIVETPNRFALVEDEVVDGVEDETPLEQVEAEGKPDEGSPDGVGNIDGSPDDCEMVIELPRKKSVSGVVGKRNSVSGDPDYEDIPLPSFDKARALRDKKSRKTFTALTYYLKCKHYMHMKDPHFIRTLVQDARAWLIRGQYKMESYKEYMILTSAVMSAFFVDQEELAFRARMKNSTEWQAIKKHNNACNGDLGYRFGGVEARFSDLRHAFQTHVTLPPSSISA